MPLFVAVRYSVACRRPHFCYDKSKQNHLWHRTRHPCLKQLCHRIPATAKPTSHCRSKARV